MSFVFAQRLGVGGRSRDDVDVDAFLWKRECDKPSDLTKAIRGPLVFELGGDVFERDLHGLHANIVEGADSYA